MSYVDVQGLPPAAKGAQSFGPTKALTRLIDTFVDPTTKPTLVLPGEGGSGSGSGSGMSTTTKVLLGLGGLGAVAFLMLGGKRRKNPTPRDKALAARRAWETKQQLGYMEDDGVRTSSPAGGILQYKRMTLSPSQLAALEAEIHAANAARVYRRAR